MRLRLSAQRRGFMTARSGAKTYVRRDRNTITYAVTTAAALAENAPAA
jgi:hypothetical protein